MKEQWETLLEVDRRCASCYGFTLPEPNRLRALPLLSQFTCRSMTGHVLLLNALLLQTMNEFLNARESGTATQCCAHETLCSSSVAGACAGCKQKPDGRSAASNCVGDVPL